MHTMTIQQLMTIVLRFPNAFSPLTLSKIFTIKYRHLESQFPHSFITRFETKTYKRPQPYRSSHQRRTLKKGYRSSHRRCPLKKGVLKNFTKFTCASVFPGNLLQAAPATLLKNTLCHRCFPMNFAKFLRTPFPQNTLGRLLLTI